MLIRDMKNPGEKIGNDVWCDLPPEALQIIISMPKTSDEIFPYSTDAIGASFTRACQFLGITDLHFHDLRHDGVSRLFETGLSILKWQACPVTGHGRASSAIPIFAKPGTNMLVGNGSLLSRAETAVELLPEGAR